MTGVAPVVKPLAESALLVELGDAIAPETSTRVLALAAALDAAALPGVHDVVPSYTTILVAFDPTVADPAAIAPAIHRLASETGTSGVPSGRRVVVPVAYGGADGPDLGDVAAHTGLPADEVVRIHSGAEYLVAAIGFAPGFPFLLGLPEALATPRRTTPRTRVPVGSVAIGGAQTGVYPMATPGGWHLIGRTRLRLFDPGAAEPFALRAGDRVRFAPEDRGDDDRDDRNAVAHRVVERDNLLEPGILVRDGGLLTTVQDLGRPGFARFGVSPGGAVDRTALILGNRLVGNPPDEAGLEITLVGPRLEFGRPAIVALTGADLGARLDGGAIPRWEPLRVRAGQTLAFDPRRAAAVGVRAYLCVAGGLAIPAVMGSRSTELFGGFGGVDGRALRDGDVLPFRDQPGDADALRRRRLAGPPPRHAASVTTRVVLGPQESRFTDESLATFLGQPYAVTAKADRMALRLEGPPLAHRGGPDLISEGIPLGAVQVPGDGQPIVLLPARQTVGGYAKIATAIGADLDALGQLRPGGEVAFRAVTVEVARAATLAYRVALGEDAVVAGRAGVIGWGYGPDAMPGGRTGMEPDRPERAAEPWTPEAVVRLIQALADADVSACTLTAPGFSLDLRRGPEGGLRPVAQPAAAPGHDEDVVVAPMIGVFYRRPAPDQPPFVEEGAAIGAGQAIGVLEVMKTYHEVTAPRSGTLAAFLIADGDFVEYGQAIARMG